MAGSAEYPCERKDGDTRPVMSLHIMCSLMRVNDPDRKKSGALYLPTSWVIENSLDRAPAGCLESLQPRAMPTTKDATWKTLR